MKLLLDTHLLLWAADQQGRLSAEAVMLIADPANELFFSVASLWEIAIKQGWGARILRWMRAYSAVGCWIMATTNCRLPANMRLL